MQAVPPNLLPPEIFEHEMAVTIAEAREYMEIPDIRFRAGFGHEACKEVGQLLDFLP